MAKTNMNIDVGAFFEQAQSQFSGLNPNEPGQWPLLPKLASFVFAAILIFGVGWVALLSGQRDELDAERNKEPQLKQEYRDKVAQAVNLAELRKQLIQVDEYVKQLEKQLPGKAEMDALLSDINQAGLGRGLDFELFRPGQVVVKDYYAELPIAIRVTGRYHDVGAFISCPPSCLCRPCSFQRAWRRARPGQGNGRCVRWLPEPGCPARHPCPHW